MNGSEPGSIDPHQASGDWENRIIGDYIEGLMAEDAKADAIPGQAESWDISEDGLVYTFHLRDGIQWSDGEPVTAADFEFAFRRLFNPATASDYAYLQFPIKGGSEIADGSMPVDFADFGVKAIDDKTLEITLEGPTPYFLQALTHYTAYPRAQARHRGKGRRLDQGREHRRQRPLQDHRVGAGQLHQVGEDPRPTTTRPTSRSTRSTTTCRTTWRPRSSAIAPASTTS